MRRPKTPPPDLSAPASSQDNPALASLLAQLARAVPTNGQVHVIAVDPRTWNASGLALPDNLIALDGGSSTKTEELMYRHIYGPYFKNGHHHIHLHFLDGSKKYKTFATEEEALSFIRRNQKRIVAKPISMKEAINTYVASRTDVKESTRITIRFRLDSFASGFEETLLQSFPAMTAWEAVLTKKNAVDTLHGIRSVANGFFRWSIREGYLTKNPLEGIEIRGKKKRGKPQLRLDEARVFLERALAVSNGDRLTKREGGQQENGALGAATALLLGLRNGEVVGLSVRDLDDGGNMLWIAASKTEAGIRRVEIPDVLRPHLLKLAGNRARTEQLFLGLTREGLLYWTKVLCKKAGLPVVCTHGLRGTHATASMRPHANPHEVAAALGHTSFRVTERHYAQPAAIASARQQAAAETLLAANPSKNPSKTFGQETVNADAK